MLRWTTSSGQERGTGAEIRTSAPGPSRECDARPKRMDDHRGSESMSRQQVVRTSGARPSVLFIDNSFTFGGAIIGLERLVKGLDELGVDSFVVSGQAPDVMDELFGEHRSATVDPNLPGRDETTLQRSVRDGAFGSGLLSRVAHEASNVDWILRREIPPAARYARIGHGRDVDIVHLNNGLGSQIDGFLASKLLRVPCIAHTRGFYKKRGRLVRATIGRIERHIAISRDVEQSLLDAGAPRDKVSLIHDAVDIERFARPVDRRAMRRDLGIPSEAKAFGFFGRMVEWKGVEEFMSATIEVLQREPRAHALVVGDQSDGDPSYFHQVQRRAEESAVGDRIVFTGYRDDVPAIMQTLDLVVHTSVRPEPFGLVIAEAMAAGTAVVAADRGGPRDIVVEGETGCLVDPRDRKALVRTILRIIRDPRLAAEMGRQGQRRAREHFSIERHARRVAEVYEQVLPTDPLRAEPRRRATGRQPTPS